MAFYSINNLSVTQGSAIVNGDETEFEDFIDESWAIFIDKTVYFIASVDSQTQITLAEPYTGPTKTDAKYFCWPTQHLAVPLFEQTSDLIDTFGPLREDMNLLTQQITDTLAAQNVTLGYKQAVEIAKAAVDQTVAYINSARDATAANAAISAGHVITTTANKDATEASKLAAAQSASDAAIAKAATEAARDTTLGYKTTTQTLRDQTQADKDATHADKLATDANLADTIAAKNQTLTALDNTEDARDAAIAAKVDAETAKAATLVSENNAAVSAQAADESAVNAAASAAAAETSKSGAAQLLNDTLAAKVEIMGFRGEMEADRDATHTDKIAAEAAAALAEQYAQITQDPLTAETIAAALDGAPVVAGKSFADPITGPAGSVTAPTFAVRDAGYGMSSSAEDNLDFTVNGRHTVSMYSQPDWKQVGIKGAGASLVFESAGTNGCYIYADGGSTANVEIDIAGKGNGGVFLGNGYYQGLYVNAPNTGLAQIKAIDSYTANQSIDIVPKGTGTVRVNGNIIYHAGNKPTKADVGLSNVDNTSDVNKPVSTATSTALNGKLSLSGGDVTGNINMMDSDLNLYYGTGSVGSIDATATDVRYYAYGTKGHFFQTAGGGDIRFPSTGGITVGASNQVYHQGNLTKATLGLGNAENKSSATIRSEITSANVTTGLGFTPVQQGTGTGQGTNTIKIGWSGSRLKATVDSTDQGNFVFDSNLTKAAVGLGNVDNTSDANKPVSTAQQTALNLKANLTGNTFTAKQFITGGSGTGNSGINNSTGSLGELEIQGNGTGAAMMTFHRPGSYAGYFGLHTDNKWKVGGWSMGAVAYELFHEGHAPTKAEVGLGSVDNTSDAAKPVSTAQQTALNLKANLASPTFTGTVTSPRLELTATGDASLASTGHAFQVGPDAGLNIIIDQNEIMARNNSGAASLNLNLDGGVVSVGGGGISTTGNVTAVEQYASGWFRPTGGTGVYWDAYGRGIHAADTGSTYGNICTYGGGRNGWTGFSINNWVSFMGNGSGAGSMRGFHSPENGGWLLSWDSNNNATFPANITAYSDERLKQNKRPIDNVKSRREGMATASMLYERDGETRVGFGAQTLEKSVPEVVKTADDLVGTKSVNYSDMVAILAADNQQQEERIIELETENAQLRDMFAALENRLTKAGI